MNRNLGLLSLMLLVALGGGCDSATDLADSAPTAKDALVGAAKPEPADLRTLDERFAEIAEQVPGFGGFFFDESGQLAVYLKDAQQHSRAMAAISNIVGAERVAQSQTRVLQADYDFLQLKTWKAQVLDLAHLPGVTLFDVDESKNRVRIGVSDPGVVDRVTKALDNLKVPQGAVIVEVTGPVNNAAVLSDHVRPLKGGITIDWGYGSLCTFGFNVRLGTQYGFVTNSHCTLTQGGVEGTIYYQRSGNQIGIETLDPEFEGTGGAKNASAMGLPCPQGYSCRRSDAAYVRFAGPVYNYDVAFGRITRTNSRGRYTGSRSFNEWDGNAPFTITAVEVSQHIMGTELNKVGQTSGWTYGPIITTCADIPRTGSKMLLCQYQVDAGVQSGDSGSPVFSWNGSNSVTLHGLLWGGNSANTVFTFSPFAAVQAELDFFDPINP